MSSTAVKRKLVTTLKEVFDDGVCIVPTETLDNLLEENRKAFTLMETHTRAMTDGLNKIANAMDTFNTENHQFHHELLEMIDNLTEAIKDQNYQRPAPNNTETPFHRNNILQERTQDEKLDKQLDVKIKPILQQRLNLHFKAFRAQNVSQYYDSLLKEEKPFVPPKFRIKVDRSTMEGTLKYRQEQAIENTIREIQIMESEFKTWNDKIENLDKEIKNIINQHIDNQESRDRQMKLYKERVERDIAKQNEDWLKNFSKLQSVYNKEMETGEQFLLKYINDRNQFNTTSQKTTEATDRTTDLPTKGTTTTDITEGN